MQSALDITGKQQSLSQYAGKISIVVNVASKCGFTESNYKGETWKARQPDLCIFPVQPSTFIVHFC